MQRVFQDFVYSSGASISTAFPVIPDVQIGDFILLHIRWYVAGSGADPTFLYQAMAGETAVIEHAWESGIAANGVRSHFAYVKATAAHTNYQITPTHNSLEFRDARVAVLRPAGVGTFVRTELIKGTGNTDTDSTAFDTPAGGAISAFTAWQNNQVRASADADYDYPFSGTSQRADYYDRMTTGALTGEVITVDAASNGVDHITIAAIISDDGVGGGGGNTAPVANDDTATTVEDTPVTIDVIDNDTDADVGDTLSVTQVNGTGISVGNPVAVTNGSVAIDGNGDLVCTPANGHTGTVTFTYTLSDGTDTDTATVVVTVNAASTPAPTATNVAAAVNNDSVTITADIDSSVAVNANATLGSIGTVAMTISGSAPNFTGTATFTGVANGTHAVSVTPNNGTAGATATGSSAVVSYNPPVAGNTKTVTIRATGDEGVVDRQYIIEVLQA